MATNSAQVPTTAFCTECGRPYPPDDLVRFGSNLVCVECKPRFVQKMREGVAAAPMAAVYGGFWIRFVALLIDGAIIVVGAMVLGFLLFAVLATLGLRFTEPTGTVIAVFAFFYLLLLALNVVYHVYFWSKKGATPGKMALGLKVVTADGGPLTVGRATGRYFAYILNGFTVYIGFIIAAFDDQKRALHDHICSTRVIRTSY